MRYLLLALQFLTRIPITVGGDVSESDLARSVSFFPLVGALVGVCSAGAWLFANQLWEPPVAAWAALLAPLLFTGALHLDGLMDTADGILSGRSRERMLEIMRDSRVGAMGVTAGAVYLLGSYAAVATIPSSRVLGALITAPTAGRWAMAMVMIRYPYARSSGTGSLFAKAGWREVTAGALISVAVTWLTLGWLGIAAVIGAVLIAVVVAAQLAKTLAGLTGDTYGAINLVTELAILLFLASRWG